MDNSSLNKCPKPSGQGSRPPPFGQCPNRPCNFFSGASLTHYPNANTKFNHGRVGHTAWASEGRDGRSRSRGPGPCRGPLFFLRIISNFWILKNHLYESSIWFIPQRTRQGSWLWLKICCSPFAFSSRSHSQLSIDSLFGINLCIYTIKVCHFASVLINYNGKI